MAETAIRQGTVPCLSFRYRGYFFDEETLFYFLQTRFYDPFTRRFVSADAYLVAGDHINSTNMFAYCLNNPIMYVDPDGKVADFTFSESLKFGYYIATLYLCLSAQNGLGMSLLDFFVFMNNCKSVEDAYYVTRVMLNGKSRGQKPFSFKDVEYVHKGASFEVCKSFTNKKICMMVAPYYTWASGVDNENEVAEEIYAHAVAYYYSNNVKSIIIGDNDITGGEALSYYFAEFVIGHVEKIDIGGTRDLDYALKPVYSRVWELC